MIEGHAFINKMLADKNIKFWSSNDLSTYIGKNINVDGNGNTSLEAGTYTIPQLEAILINAVNERGTMKLD